MENRSGTAGAPGPFRSQGPPGLERPSGDPSGSRGSIEKQTEAECPGAFGSEAVEPITWIPTPKGSSGVSLQVQLETEQEEPRETFYAPTQKAKRSGK